MDLQLKGKRALVTGSTGGIGWAIARELATEGTCVVVNGRNAARLAIAARRIRAEVRGADVEVVQADLSSAEGCQQLIGAAEEVDIRVDGGVVRSLI